MNVSTNVHFHGMQVTPEYEHGDSIFVSIDGFMTHTYHFLVPLWHPEGIYWYHSHIPYLNEFQVNNGMAGVIIVGDVLSKFPQIQDIEQSLFQLKDLQIVPHDSGQFYVSAPSPLDSDAPTNRSVNGEIYPWKRIEENEMQLWMFANIGPNIYYNLYFGGNPMYLLVRDGVIQTELQVSTKGYLLGPGARAGFLVIGPPAGSYNISTLPYSTGPQGDSYPYVDLMYIKSVRSNRSPPALPSIGFPHWKDLRREKVNRERTVVFSENASGLEFYINGLQFDIDRIDFIVKLGDIERWTIVNTANEDHFFHIHQIAFQVEVLNNKTVPFIGYQDTVQLPKQSSVILLLPFDEDIIVGKFVTHCHILGHEDAGMMATVLVEDK